MKKYQKKRKKNLEDQLIIKIKNKTKENQKKKNKEKFCVGCIKPRKIRNFQKW